MATNKNITMKQYNGVDYDTLYPKTIASQIDDVYSKDEMSNLFLPKAGGSMGGILDMNGNRITNLPTPTSNSDPATKEYVDGKTIFYEKGSYIGNEQLTKTITFSKNIFYFVVVGDNQMSEAMKGDSSLYNKSYSIAFIDMTNNNITISTDLRGNLPYFNKDGYSYSYFGLFE